MDTQNKNTPATGDISEFIPTASNDGAIYSVPCEPTCGPASRWEEGEKAYIGTKVVRGIAMTESDFLKKHKGITEDELSKRETYGEGYKVTYEDGYVSWAPKDIFERCYREVSNKEFGILSAF